MSTTAKAPLVSWDEITERAPLSPESLGSEEFKRDYGTKWAYYTGSMYRGIASTDLVIRAAKAGVLSFFGSAGFSIEELDEHLNTMQKALKKSDPYGMCLLCNLIEPQMEMETVELFMKHKLKFVEVSAFATITVALVFWRVKGIKKVGDTIEIPHKVIAKLSRPEVAAAFLSPPPEKLLKALVVEGKLTAEEAKLAEQIPMADDITAESSSGGHTDDMASFALTPTIIKMRDDAMKEYEYTKKVRVGAAGGIGCPQAIAAAFIMGVDYVVTGSVNQCTVEAGISDAVKDLLAEANIQDMDFAPAGDMFEIGARVQVLKKGVFFAARANKLYELYKNCNSLEDIDEKTRNKVEKIYFKRSFDEIWDETKAYWNARRPDEIDKAEQNPKQKMSLVFRWYFGLSSRVSFQGNLDRKVDFQVHTGPALGAFNQWVKGTHYESWHNRHVDDVAALLMKGACKVMQVNILKNTGFSLDPQFEEIVPSL